MDHNFLINMGHLRPFYHFPKICVLDKGQRCVDHSLDGPIREFLQTYFRNHSWEHLRKCVHVCVIEALSISIRVYV